MKYKPAISIINRDLENCLIHKDKAPHYPQYAEPLSESYLIKSRILQKLERPNEALDNIDYTIDISNNMIEIEIQPENAVLYYQKAKILYSLRYYAGCCYMY